MIAKETYTIDYVNTLREKYKKDPSLLERVLFAFGLLEAITRVGMPFFSRAAHPCTRLYGKTKATCNEYASRKSYKDRLFKHPIHTEFTKSYNRLYGRIRRGKLPEDTPLMDELKALHDEYYVKYENTHRQDREAVWWEYMQKNKELLG